MTPRPYVPTFGESVAPVRHIPASRVAEEVNTVRPPGISIRRRPLIKQGRVQPRPHADGWYVVQAFADALRSERERRGWTQTATAAHLGMGQSQYRKLENGYVASTIRTVNRLCRRLGITFALGEWPE